MRPVDGHASARFAFTILLLGAAQSARAEVVTTSGVTACTVQTGRYRLRVDTTSPVLFSLSAPDGRPLLRGVGDVAVQVGARRFTWDSRVRPHLHALRAGRYLAEIALENIVLQSSGETWPGLAEMHLTCHEDRVFVHARFLLPGGAWVHAGDWVYARPKGHTEAASTAPTAARVTFRMAQLPAEAPGGLLAGARPGLAALATLPAASRLVPDASRLVPDASRLSLSVPVGTVPWKPGDAREAACAFLIAPDRAQARRMLDDARHPLPAGAFRATMGQVEGYDARTGLYGFRAQTSSTPEPPRGLRAGTHFAVANDGRRRTLLVDSRDPWGGITGGLLRDVRGVPLPVPAQFALNFPELSEAREPGWARLTFPLALAPDEKGALRVEHLYGGAREHDLVYLNTLENIGDPLLLQATVSRVESFTVTTGPYPGQLKPGNELRINDFRRHFKDIKIRSVSAILPTFFGCYDAQDRYQGLVPGAFRITEAGPFLAEATVRARTPDGAVSGEVRFWQVPSSDMTRLFTDVALRVHRDVPLSTRRAAPLFFLRHHAFNPMAFRRAAAWVAPGRTLEMPMEYAPKVMANGQALGEKPFGLLYRADNPLDQGLPTSDITGNPGWLLRDFSARRGREEIRPGLYAFTTGANDINEGDYSRDLAVVPAEPLRVLRAGTVIRYRALHVVYGDNGSDAGPMRREREAWAVHPLRARATVGTVMAHDPPTVQADGNRAEFTLTGGTDWMAVRLRGLAGTGRLRVDRVGADGKMEPLHDPRDDAPWYTCWPDGPGRVGCTFLVRLPADGRPLRLRARWVAE